MARVTVEDCINKVPNRFKLVLMAAKRARDIERGAKPSVVRDNDKSTILALREIAEDAVSTEDLEELAKQSIISGEAEQPYEHEEEKIQIPEDEEYGEDDKIDDESIDEEEEFDEDDDWDISDNPYNRHYSVGNGASTDLSDADNDVVEEYNDETEQCDLEDDGESDEDYLPDNLPDNYPSDNDDYDDETNKRDFER